MQHFFIKITEALTGLCCLRQIRNASERNAKKKASGFNGHIYKNSRTTEVLKIMFKRLLWFSNVTKLTTEGLKLFFDIFITLL